jgi:hypothetical protein
VSAPVPTMPKLACQPSRRREPPPSPAVPNALGGASAATAGGTTTSRWARPPGMIRSVPWYAPSPALLHPTHGRFFGSTQSKGPPGESRWVARRRGVGLGDGATALRLAVSIRGSGGRRRAECWHGRHGAAPQRWHLTYRRCSFEERTSRSRVDARPPCTSTDRLEARVLGTGRRSVCEGER